MSFAESFRQGREEARAARNAPPLRPSTRPPAPPGAPRRPVADQPSPIKIGYYCDLNSDDPGMPPMPLLSFTERHILLFGLNGAGKSTRVLIELLMTIRNRSGFIYDIKGELAFQTADELRKYFDVKIIAPYGDHRLHSDGCNPIAHLNPDIPEFYDEAEALSAAKIELEDGAGRFFSERAQQWSTCGIMFETIMAKREKRQPLLTNVHRLLTEGDGFEIKRGPDGKAQKRQVKGMQALAARMMAAGNEALATLASSFVRAEGAGKNELSGIQATYAQQCSWVLSAPMRADLCKNGVDLRQLNSGPRPLVVFVVMPASQISAKRRYSRMLVTAALQGHMKPGKRSTLFVLDEFRASVGSMPIINDVWSLVRGYGCQLMPIVQSALQLKALFKDEWENYIAQAGLVATLGPANDEFTAEWMSKRSGVTTILQAGFNLGDGINSGDGMSTGTGMSGGGGSSNQGNSSNKGRSRNGGLSYQQTEQRVLLKQDIMNIRAGHGLIWLPGMGVSTIPFFAPNFWDRNEAWVARVRRNPFHSG